MGQMDDECFDDAWGAAVGAFLSAARDGWRAEWLRKFFSDAYPADESDVSVISDIMLKIEGDYRRAISECYQCGRLWVQTAPGVNEYRSYAPDEGGYAEIVRGQMAEG